MEFKTMLIVNEGKQGMNRNWLHANGTREEKHFPPTVVVECSVLMGEYLIKKYSDPVMEIYFRRADGESLNQPVLESDSKNEAEDFIPEVSPYKKHAGRPKGSYKRK